jgi:hypothetical protein
MIENHFTSTPKVEVDETDNILREEVPEKTHEQ